MIAIIALFILYVGTSFSAHLSIKRTILLHGHLIQAFTADIGEKYHTDQRYGICYTINESKSQKYANKPTAILGTCLKKNKIGMYYKGSLGLF